MQCSLALQGSISHARVPPHSPGFARQGAASLSPHCCLLQQGTGTPPRGHSKNTSVGDESAAWAGVATRSGPASESTRSSAQASDVSAGLEPARGPRSSSADGDAPLDIRSVGSEESDAGNGLSDDAVPAAHVPLVFNGPAGPGHAAGGTGLAAARMFVVDAVVQSRAGHRSMVSLVGSILETDHVALPGLALEEACAPAAPVEGRYAENVDRGFPDASTSGPGSAAGAARVRVVRGGVRLTVRYEPPSPKFRQKNPGMVSFRVAVSEQPAQESESSESTAFLVRATETRLRMCCFRCQVCEGAVDGRAGAHRHALCV